MKKLMLPAFLLFAALTFATAQNVVEKTTSNNQHWTNWQYASYDSHRDPCKVFIGVITAPAENGGLTITELIENTPAAASGVKKGDIILAIDGVKVGTQSELLRQRDTHGQGESFTLTLVRNGAPETITAQFKTCTEAEKEMALERKNQKRERRLEMEARMADQYQESAGMEVTERPLLGIYPGDEENSKGVRIGNVISGKGAAAAGLRSGDLILNVDGKNLSTGGIAAALYNHKSGDVVTVTYERNGTVAAANVTLSGERTWTPRVERDPCKIFIGIYTSDKAIDGQGVKVSGVIDNTPAKESDIRPGDIVLQIDGVPVSTHNEVITERDKHQPGDAFTLSILRDGEIVVIPAKFKSCDKQTEVKTEVKQETAPTPTEERVVPILDNSLELNVFTIAPNPTIGPLTIQFEGTAVPTTVRITDVSGKVVYNKTLNQFNGFFNEQVNLEGRAPGNYVLSVQQGEQWSTKQFVLLPRA